MSIAITWYDNAAFKVVCNKRILWFDPSINKNPDSPIKTSDLKEKADFVFTTHGDSGHFVNSVEMAIKTDSFFGAPEELCQYVLDQKQLGRERLIPLCFGENRIADDLNVFVFEAEHPELSQEILREMAKWGYLTTKNAGFIVRIGNINICHLGDAFYSDVFKQINRQFTIDIAMIPIQGKKTGASLDEAVESAARIIGDLNPAIILPVIQYTKHMNRVEPLKKRLVELQIQSQVIFDKPGMEYIFDHIPH
jgi:L-ascorbate metabolism protein UlaG (beta-lactamase superfamily)